MAKSLEGFLYVLQNLTTANIDFINDGSPNQVDLGEYQREIEQVQYLINMLFLDTTKHSEYGGTVRCMTSDGRNVNVAEELNRLENE